MDENTLEYAAPSAGALIAAIYDRTPIESGVTYKVIWDGEEYECVAKENTLGNESIYTNTAEDTGEPFYFRPSSMRIYAKTEGQHTHVVKREMNVYHALDKRYLPEDVAYLESIPEVKPALVITVSEADGTYTTDSIASTTEISDAAQSGRPVYVKEGNAEAFKLYSLSWCEKLYNYDNYPYVFDDS